MKIAIILEAAGNSTRFGSNKLLHIMDDGRPMVCAALDAARIAAMSVAENAADAGTREMDPARTDETASAETGEMVFPEFCKPSVNIILVTQYPEVAALASSRSKAFDDAGEIIIDIVMNHHPELGISHSMQLGIEAAGDADAFMFCVCDQPGLRASTILKLIDSYVSTDAGIVSLSWGGKMCNPKIFSSKYRDELMNISGDTGGRQIISDHLDDLLAVEADAEAETLDIDHPDVDLPDADLP